MDVLHGYVDLNVLQAKKIQLSIADGAAVFRLDGDQAGYDFGSRDSIYLSSQSAPITIETRFPLRAFLRSVLARKALIRGVEVGAEHKGQMVRRASLTTAIIILFTIISVYSTSSSLQRQGLVRKLLHRCHTARSSVPTVRPGQAAGAGRAHAQRLGWGGATAATSFPTSVVQVRFNPIDRRIIFLFIISLYLFFPERLNPSRSGLLRTQAPRGWLGLFFPANSFPRAFGS